MLQSYLPYTTIFKEVISLIVPIPTPPHNICKFILKCRFFFKLALAKHVKLKKGKFHSCLMLKKKQKNN